MSESAVDEGGRVCQRVWLTKEAVCVRECGRRRRPCVQRVWYTKEAACVRECGRRRRPCVSESVVDEGGPVCQRAW